MEAGRYLIKHRGTFDRELDPAEYQRLRAAEVRGFSGHWVLFCLLPRLLLGYSPRLSR